MLYMCSKYVFKIIFVPDGIYRAIEHGEGPLKCQPKYLLLSR